MGKYDSFIANRTKAIKYFDGSIDFTYPGHFFLSFDKWVRTNNIECEIRDNLNSVLISAPNFQIVLDLRSEDGQIERASIKGRGNLVKEIRDSIWDTKTFFGVPVFMVMNTSFDDETYWEDFPRQFTVLMITTDNINFICD